MRIVHVLALILAAGDLGTLVELCRPCCVTQRFMLELTTLAARRLIRGLNGPELGRPRLIIVTIIIVILRVLETQIA